ncbi:MAG TPA: hypothetical protein K8V56_06150 [Sporosarcina psychrophila]|uniref:Uncharacterized protein n=1 Tax=Sporosarcina psychrophila TaxID=1476 RepID=A0A921KCD7_SPOPS|nr:hypothetical protein [Sporosarcina psychrophila]
MSDRFELNFKNKEVRIWLVIMIPAMIAGVLIMLFAETKQQYITSSFPVIAWMIFYIWRYFYRRKQKKESSVI